MKLLKLLPLLLVFMIFNSNAHAAKNCDEIKGNIVGKLFCNVTSNSGLTSSEATVDSEKKKGILSKIWTRPEWTKKKKNN
jgi:hypothetical protein|tara:strand:- start:277 stop:516 length:240 start_codon:yes stop_codon:yes gene_type:complete